MKKRSRKGRRISDSVWPRCESELEHQQEGHDAGVGLGEVPEVVVARDLAAEGRVLLAHALLDEGVPDAVDQRHATRALDRLRHGPARADVVDDLRARFFRKHQLGEEGRCEVAGHELARVVDEEAAVGVPVEGGPEVGAFLERLGDDELAVLGQERVRQVVREGAVRLEVVATTSSCGRRSSTGGSSTPPIPFAASITIFSGLIASASTNESTRSTYCSQMS